MSSRVLSLGLSTVDIMISNVDSLPARGKLARISPIVLSTGGIAATFAVDLAILGIRTKLVSRLGTDERGSLARRYFEEAGLDVEFMQVSPGDTCTSLVFIAADGERSFLTNFGVGEFLELPGPEVFGGVEHLHLGGTPLFPRLNVKSLIDFVVEARTRGITISLDTLWDPDHNWDGFRQIIGHVDYVFPNEIEAQAISGTDGIGDALSWFNERVRKACVIKRGAAGASFLEGGRVVTVDSPHVKVADTTGAGEAFASGFVYSILEEGSSVREAVCFGVACGALCVTKIGGPTAMVGAGAVRKWLDLVRRGKAEDCDGNREGIPVVADFRS